MAEEKIASHLPPIWLVKFPIQSHYEESPGEVKALARKAGVRVVNAKFAGFIGEQYIAKDTPTLTPKGDGGKKSTAKKANAKKASEATKTASTEEGAGQAEE